MSRTESTRWLDSMSWQVDFYQRSGRAKRNDPEFDWKTYERSGSGRFPETRRILKRILFKAGLWKREPMSIEWMRANGEALWEARTILDGDLSRLFFDSALTVRLTSHRHFYFPRIDFSDFLEVRCGVPFTHSGFPHDYIGIPLGIFDVSLNARPELPQLRVITREIQLALVNSYRQYFVTRNGVDITPVPGDVVLDCGACIGEISMLFAGLVAPAGQVHLFDPIPLHTRFCELQASLNPAYASMLHINTLAVGDRTYEAPSAQTESRKITPGAVSTDMFSCTTLDDYAARKLKRVDFIKMDIEGAEVAALNGSANVIREFRPRLAISGYHKPEDLWEIPQLLRKLNPAYTIGFGHHTPIGWESVFYATDHPVAHKD